MLLLIEAAFQGDGVLIYFFFFQVHTLRNENVRLEEKLEEFDQISLELRKASAQVEDLKAQIATKNNLER